MPAKLTDEERTRRLLAAFDRPETGCWEWTGRVDRDGYGRVGRGQLAYVVVWVHFHGPVPAGKELDHLCRNRRCVRPEHMEPVPHRTNVLRGDSPSARNARKTKCAEGHPFTGRSGKKRTCNVCQAAASRRYRARRSG